MRGELLMPLAAFKRMNDEREKQGLSQFANPRNATAGTVRQLEPVSRRNDGSISSDTFCCATAARCSTANRKRWMRSRPPGSRSNPHRRLAKNMEEVWAFIQEWEKKRESLPYEIDGIVIKVDRTGLQEELGFTGKALAGRSPTSTPLAAGSRRSKTSWCRSDARENSRRSRR